MDLKRFITLTQGYKFTYVKSAETFLFKNRIFMDDLALSCIDTDKFVVAKTQLTTTFARLAWLYLYNQDFLYKSSHNRKPRKVQPAQAAQPIVCHSIGQGSTMDKLQLSGQNLGRVFNFSNGCVHATQLYFFETKLPSLKLKTRPEQLLCSLPLVIALPRLI